MGEPVICVVGLGYVGLPLAVEFSKQFTTIGFDISEDRIRELQAASDRTLEVPQEALRELAALTFTSNASDLQAANHYIVTVPTPIDKHKRPDLGPLIAASKAIGEVLTHGDLVVYESTVYPGATEEVCVPELERWSGLAFNRDFFVGYSPERINPGDHQHRLPDIRKVTSGSTPETAESVDALYRRIIRAGTHKAPSIQVAEAAKVIENIQRDVNIALVNELAILFDKLGIDTQNVLEAAGTKWNFLPFRPGLVGGHCIGVDPYYLTHKAQEVGYHPEVILAGRRINDSMGSYIADRVVLLLARRGIPVGGARVLILGLAFKEDCPDLRNTRVVDVIDRLREYGVSVEVDDPWVDPEEARREYGIDLINRESDPPRTYEGAVLAVAHAEYLRSEAQLRALIVDSGFLFDVKGVLPAGVADARL